MAFTKYTGTLTGQVGSLITALDAALVTGQGWTTPFTGTNTKVYRPPSGARHFFLINDNGPGASGAQEARIRGYATKADALDVPDVSNADPFPTAAQKTNGQFIRKSAAADGTARNYVIYADSTTCHIFIYTGDVANVSMGHSFGALYDFSAVNTWNSYVACRLTESSASAAIGALEAPGNSNFYLSRSYTTASGAVAGGAMCTPAQSNGSNYNGAIPFPNGPDGGLVFSRLFVAEGSTLYGNHNRGYLRGLWGPQHATTNFTDAEVRTGTGSLSTRTFECRKCVNSQVWFIETSNTVETNG